MMYADPCCTYRETMDNYLYSGKCIITGELYTVSIPKQELYNYRQGALIQNAMPSVSADDREFLMSGISPKGWKEKFGDEE